jgi:hypothetical protein
LAVGVVAAGSTGAGSLAGGVVAAGSTGAGSLAGGVVAAGSTGAGSLAGGVVAAGSTGAGSLAGGVVAAESTGAGSLAVGVARGSPATGVAVGSPTEVGSLTTGAVAAGSAAVVCAPAAAASAAVSTRARAKVRSVRKTVDAQHRCPPPRRDVPVQRLKALPSGKGPQPSKVVFPVWRCCQHRSNGAGRCPPTNKLLIGALATVVGPKRGRRAPSARDDSSSSCRRELTTVRAPLARARA